MNRVFTLNCLFIICTLYPKRKMSKEEIIEAIDPNDSMDKLEDLLGSESGSDRLFDSDAK